MSHSIRRVAVVSIAILVVSLLFAKQPAHAQTTDPWSAADTVRRTLFSAQASVLAADHSEPTTQVNTALAAYKQSLQAPILAAAPEIAGDLDRAFNDVLNAAQKGDSLSLSASRSRIWTGLLHGSMRVVLKAIESSDLTTAREWLQLRDFRKSTKFSRPGADSTLAVNSLIAGQKSATDALAAVRTDLLDTYQAKLNQALVNADNAQQQGFDEKQAEQTALAAGYFDLLTDTTLSNVFVSLHDADALSASRVSFGKLVAATLAHDGDGYRAARTEVDATLKGFRAAPLSDAEQARRAGQLSQFVSLVSVEYGRGVANGKIIKDLEIQEALTFREGANAAFTDLQSVLETRDAAATVKVASLLAILKTQINATVDPSAVDATVNEISSTLNTIYPASWQTLNSGSDFDVINSVLDQIEPAVKQGQYAQAENARLQAYAILDSGVEQKLRGFAPELAIRVESLFWQGDGRQTGLAVLLTSNAPLDQVKASLSALRTALNDSETFLGGAQTAPAAVAGNAAVIVFREGLEAVLILASLVASMRMDNTRKYRRAIMAGAGLALAASGVTWWIANGLLMSMIKYGEKLSVIVGIIAIGVLLLITNWFFHKTYWTGWIASFHKQKGRILGGTLILGPTLGLVLLGFTSIYREGFETVLFLQSLVLDAGLLTVLEGVGLGLLATALVGVIVFGLQVRLPAKRLLIVTGILIGVVLLTMVGNTVHAAQSVGWLPITPIRSLDVPYWMGQWFGFFATWQGIIGQIIAAAFVIGSYLLAEWVNSQKRTKRETERTSDAAIGVSSIGQV